MQDDLYYIENINTIIEDGRNDINGWEETGWTSEIGIIIDDIISGKIPNLFKKTDFADNSIQLVHIHKNSESWYYPNFYAKKISPVLFKDDKEFII